MAIISQISLFNWENDIEILGDLERLQLVLENLPDESLMQAMERDRGNGRDDYPIREMWNGLIAGVIFGHSSIASFIRELNRNVQLRYICGFTAIGKVPQKHNYTRFIKLLLRHQDELDSMFQELVKLLQKELPDFGERLAIDSKYVRSFSNRKSKKDKQDGRRDLDADLGMKKYYGVHKDGTPWERVVKCFGYKFHIIADAKYELPVAYEVTKASASDVVQGHKLLDKLKCAQPEIIDRCIYLSADKGYDDSKFIEKLYEEENDIIGIIDKRSMWKNQSEKQIPGYENAFYNEDGEVFCYDPQNCDKRTMSNNGYEKERDCIRKNCPAKAYGVKCSGYEQCKIKGGIRIPLETDTRIFNKVDRSSYKWKTEYKHRTAVERVNSRLDVSLGFENHTIRGRSKMEMRCSLALILMLTMALGRIRQERPDLMRSTVRCA